MDRIICKYKNAGIFGSFLFGATLGIAFWIAMAILWVLLLSPIATGLWLTVCGLGLIFTCVAAILLAIARHSETKRLRNEYRRFCNKFCRYL